MFLSVLRGFLFLAEPRQLNKDIIQIHKEIEMATQKDNLLVSLLKRSVGMSSGASGCCGAPSACGCGSSAGSATAQAPTQAPEEATPPAEPKPDAVGRSGCC